MQQAILGVEGQHGDADDRVTARAAWQLAPPATRLLSIGCAVGSVVVAAVWLRQAPAVAGTALCIALLTVAALVDAVDRRLPNELVGPAAVPVGVAAALVLAAGSSTVAMGALAGAAVVGAPLLATHVVSPRGMGFGDVKAGTVLGAGVGLVSVPAAALTLLLALAGSGAWAVARRQRHVALGPGLVAGAVAALVLARALGVEAN